MDRKERRRIEKRLGITKHKKTLSLSERMESVSQNIELGKQKQIEMLEVRRQQEGNKSNEIDNNRIASIATELMIGKDMSYIDALEKAKEVYKEEVETLKNTE